MYQPLITYISDFRTDEEYIRYFYLSFAIPIYSENFMGTVGKRKKKNK